MEEVRKFIWVSTSNKMVALTLFQQSMRFGISKRGVNGYIGGNTLIEIGVAFYLKKKIYILNPVSSELSYKQEIMGMKPVMLNNNFSLI